MKPTADSKAFERECKIRDEYASRLAEFRPDELLLKTEYTFVESGKRADMRTVDNSNTLRVWEFKLVAGYEGLGQVLTYLALARRAVQFDRPVRGTLAAFRITDEIRQANEILNLGIELVELPPKLRMAGGLLEDEALPDPLPAIPNLAALTSLTEHSR